MSLMTRAMLAVALMIGFYTLALALIAGLLYIPYAEWRYLGRVHFQLALACGALAFAIAMAMVPRPDRFEPPGPELTADTQPRLFQLVEDVARATAQESPRDVYLLPDVNAFVSHRGGVMGIGSRRVMGLGLPLLQGLTTQQLRGVIAHEFGHYVGGDVALAPWVHKTRAAIGRAIERLGDSWASHVFNAYGKLFMRLTMAISRRQEFVADEVAASVAGVAPMKAALSQVAVLASAHAAYFLYEVVPVLESGFLPPIAAGFARYRASPVFAAGSTSLIDHEMTTGETGPFDSHPALRDRLAALDRATGATALEDETPALSLLDGLEDLERDLLAHRAGAARVATLAAIDWAAVPKMVYLPKWAMIVEAHRARLSSMTVGDLPEGGQAFRAAGRSFMPRTRIVPDEEYVAEAIHTLGCALAMRLIGLGWTLRGGVGQPISLNLGDDTVEPFMVLGALANGRATASAWRTEADRLGIAPLTMA